MQILLKYQIWFKRHNRLNFKVHFFKVNMQSCEHAVAAQIFNNNEPNFAQLFRQQVKRFGDDECQQPSRFKLNVQNVHQLQQRTIEVSFDMTGLPYH